MSAIARDCLRLLSFGSRRSTIARDCPRLLAIVHFWKP
jgi:hypothetical protein